MSTIIEWFVILTIGCLPIEQQPPGANCVIETKIVEAHVFNREKAESIVENFPSKMTQALPGSFAIARYEKRVTKKVKEETK